ncbi:hypothetical protein BGW42_008633 [Actinomortierella wolfii]|nr:hypothetical protein BGW42_008633 [Actinomortierella wolfii]
MVEDGIANDLCSRRPPMLVSQPGSFISNHLHRRYSDYMLESPTLSSQFQYPHQSSSQPSPQPHRLSLHQQHMQQQHLQKQHRYSISDYVPAFALKDSKLGAVHLDAYHQQQHQSSSDDEHRVGGRSRGTGPSSIDDSVAGSTALSMSGDLPHNASEVRLTHTTITIPLEDNNSSDMVAPIPQDDISVDETMEATKQEEDRNKSIKRDRRPSLRRLPSSPPLLKLHHQRLQQEQEQQQQEQDLQDATVISLSIPEPLVSPTMTTPSEHPAAIFSFGEGYTSTPVVDPKHEEAKQTAQAARRISRRLTMEDWLAKGNHCGLVVVPVWQQANNATTRVYTPQNQQLLFHQQIFHSSECYVHPSP